MELEDILQELENPTPPPKQQQAAPATGQESFGNSSNEKQVKQEFTYDINAGKSGKKAPTYKTAPME